MKQSSANPLPAEPVPHTHSASVVSALATLDAEQAGLAALREALTGRLGVAFEVAVATIQNSTGRVVVTGMGKSGHVARKIAATLPSTATPAHHVHPAEASHGDIGMITADDVIVALSWSGETVELRDLVEYSRRFDVPLIAFTSNGESALASSASVVLTLPVAQEACPLGLAPTTSTVMQLALGDALAVALLQSRGFTALDFRQLHPGGKLGASLKFVRDVMRAGEQVPLARRGALMGEVLVEIVATERGDGFRQPVGLIGPYPSGAPAIFIDQVGKLGQAAAIVSRVGDDDFGHVNLERLRRDGVDVSGGGVDAHVDVLVAAGGMRDRRDDQHQGGSVQAGNGLHQADFVVAAQRRGQGEGPPLAAGEHRCRLVGDGVEVDPVVAVAVDPWVAGVCESAVEGAEEQFGGGLDRVTAGRPGAQVLGRGCGHCWLPAGGFGQPASASFARRLAASSRACWSSVIHAARSAGGVRSGGVAVWMVRSW